MFRLRPAVAASTLIALVLGLALTMPAPALADSGVTIHGKVTMPDGSLPDVIPGFLLSCDGSGISGVSCANFTSSYSQATGIYNISAPAGTYVFGTTYSGPMSDIVPKVFWTGGASQSTTGVAQTFTAGQDYSIDLSFVQGAIITGHLTGADAALPASGPKIFGRLASGYGSFSGTFDSATQTYRIDSLATGSYTFTFSDPVSYVSTTQLISVTAGQTTVGPDIALVRTATVHGTVRLPDGTPADGQVQIMVCGSDATSTGCGYGAGFTYDQSTGVYSFTLDPGHYIVEFEYRGQQLAVQPSVYWGGNAVTGSNHTVTAGEDIPLDVSFLAGAAITGTVAGADGPLASATIAAVPISSPFDVSYGVLDATTHTYTIGHLVPGNYFVHFASDVRHDDQYWDASATLDGSTTLTLVAGETETGIDATLPLRSRVGGHLTANYSSGTAPAEYGLVYLVPDGATSVTDGVEAQADSSGEFNFYGAAPGTYRLCAATNEYFVDNCWGGGTVSTAPTFTLSASQQITGQDLNLDVGGQILANLRSQDGVSVPQQLSDGVADLWKRDDADGSYEFVREVESRGGSFNVTGVPIGDYRIEFRDPAGQYSSQWWKGHRYFAESDDVTVPYENFVQLGDVTLHDRDFDVARTSGPDRFAGAVAMTQEIWAPPTEVPGDGGVPPAGVPVIYIANGLKYPDALSAGPAAILQGGALLLVMPTSIPSSVAAELTRLRPQKIVIVGGPASVSDDVEAQLSAYSPDVERQSGADRFEASRNLAKAVWNAPGVGGAPEVFIATGNNFPDALAAGPAAGSIGAPVILVNGLQQHLDQATQDLLISLGTTDVDIVGGPNSVTPGVESDLANLMHGTDHVHRYSGATRYDAAAAMNQDFFPQAAIVFAATGANFPDALAGAPLAGVYGAPIYLTQPTCISQVVAANVLEDDTQGIWLLGGPASLSPAVEDLELCAS